MPIDMLVLHYTGMKTAQAALDRLCDPEARVSSHYVVEEDGTVWSLVSEGRRAWHAGVSWWRGRTELNARSIGIEIVNPGHEWGYRAFPPAQIAVVRALCRGILNRHPISACDVVGHSDVAPDRKQDPGELFPWERLAADGIGVWPPHRDRAGGASEESGGSDDEARASLARIGYRVDGMSLRVVLEAFQRHWLPNRISGVYDRATADRVGDFI